MSAKREGVRWESVSGKGIMQEGKLLFDREVAGYKNTSCVTKVGTAVYQSGGTHAPGATIYPVFPPCKDKGSRLAMSNSGLSPLSFFSTPFLRLPLVAAGTTS